MMISPNLEPKNNVTIRDVVYNYSFQNNSKITKKSIEVIGLDTEADENGKCFMMATSLKDIFTPSKFLQSLTSRKYRGCNFVCYNLKYDEGAILQFLTIEELQELRKEGKVKHGMYNIKSIPTKMLSIRRGKNTVHFYDMYNFYQGSLNYNAKMYLNESKLDIETKTFSTDYYLSNWDRIGKYCIQDAILVKKLADLIIKKFEQFGIYPRKLYSTAYISYQYFTKHTNYVTVKRYWNTNNSLLEYSMFSYCGGKFEVTEKGTGYFYEYDIVSAYPYEISNLIDISNARVVWSKKYRKYAIYGFLYVSLKIPSEVYSPVPQKRNNVNVYPTGDLCCYITKKEYEYLVSQNVDITIINAVWLHVEKKEYPYKKEINRLVELKKNINKNENPLDYHTIKIFLNSIYGKMVQLIKINDKYRATNCWNPIYGAVITANCRIRISEFQQKFPDVIAVHTDSIISKSKLDIEEGSNLGDMKYECEGDGLIVGAGVYEIGDKTRFRGFPSGVRLSELLQTKNATVKISHIRPYTWKEVAFHGWEHDLINRFVNEEKTLRVDFDSKRLWINDYKSFKDLFKRNVHSLSLDNLILKL